MQQRLLSNIAFLVFVNFLVKPFWILGIDRVVQNTVGAQDYGTYFAIFNFSFLFHMILDMGINNYNSRTIAQSPEKLGDFFANILGLKVLLALVYLLVTFGIAISVQYDSLQLKLLGFMALNQVLISAIFYLRSNVAALHHFRIDAFLSILDRGLMILICSFLLWGPFVQETFRIEWFVYAQTAAYLVATLVSLLFVLRLGSSFTWNIRLGSVFQIVKETYPFALVGIMMAIYNRVDAVMLERMLPDGKEEAGIYAASYRLLDAVNMAGYLFATILLPAFSRMIKQSVDFRPVFKVTFNALYFIAWIVAVGSFFFSEEIMSVLYPAADPYWFSILELLMFSFVPICSVYIFGTLMVANGNLKQLNYIVAFGVLLNLGLNFILIPQHKALGATTATLITQVIIAIAHIAMAGKLLKLSPNWNVIFRLITFSILTVLIFWLASSFSGTSWQTSLLFLLAASAVSILMAHLIGLIQLNSLIDLLRSNKD